ncbi:MAG TPA: T9SS type A sorting domain-containing protein [Puia sp.]|nr:T9SS type A sorting domain-containing protein [Puia sp.]
MKKFLPAAFITLPIFCIEIAIAQPDQFVYAVTSLQKGGTEWISLRRLNTQTNELSTLIQNGTDRTIGIYDAGNMRKIESFVNDTLMNANPQAIFGSGVAAIGYDRTTNRLFFTPMLVDELRYIDLGTMKVFSVTDQSFGKAGNFQFYAGAISRMVVAPDGYGYTVTNDGEHLLRFNTRGNIVITDLGPLQESPANTEAAKNNACANAGGDLVADDNGNLYLFTASNRVFEVNISSRDTKYLGTISGLPQGFTTNGAAADEYGNVIVSSSVFSESYFLVDPKTWRGSTYKPANENYGAADLANGNTLNIQSNPVIKTFSRFSNNIRVFPNPVFNDQFTVQFSNLRAANYTIQLTDAFGGKVLEHKVKVTQANQSETINIPGGNAQGSYFLIVLDENNLNLYSQIILLER